MVSITSGRAGPRPRPKGAPLSRVKSPNFYKIIYIFKGYAFYLFISDVKDIINFIIDLQITMLLIIKKVI